MSRRGNRGKLAAGKAGRFFGFVVFILVLCVPAQAAKVPAAVGQRCESCHDRYAFRAQFSDSAHGNNGCTSCHAGIKDIGRHISGEVKPEAVSCRSCHQEIERKHQKSVHFLSQNIQCQDCHADIHTLKKSGADRKKAVTDNCTKCHSAEEYALMGHGQSLLKGNRDAAACSDCHGIHDVRAFQTGKKKDILASRAYYTERCKACHADEVLTRRNNLSTHTVKSYDESYHGKVHSIGAPQLVAGCAYCHTGHNILPRKDTRSVLHPDNLKGQ